MALRALEGERFVRKTQLAPGEYRKNFRQIDCDILSAVTSVEADTVTPLMSKVYLRLVNAPERFWEREGVLRIEAEPRGEKLLKAWAVLCDLAGVSSATASKALRWMHEQGIIGYFSGKNGVGLRIFLNRAASSVGVRAHKGGEKILTFPPASSTDAPASANETAFNVPYGDLESLDTDRKTPAPKNGAVIRRAGNYILRPDRRGSTDQRTSMTPEGAPRREPDSFSLEDVVTRLRTELEPAMREAARQAAAREHERTREWLENRGLPKAARVVQHEAFNLLRKYCVIGEASRTHRPQTDVGRKSYAPTEPHPLSAGEVEEFAQACLAMLETQGQSIEVTLSEMSSEAGGFLLAEDAGRVREKVNFLLSAGDGGGGK